MQSRQEESDSRSIQVGSAFSELLRQHRQQVYNMAFDLTGDQAEAEDLVQDVFIKVFNALASFRGDAKPSTWLYRITVNAFIDRSRTKAFAASRQSEDFRDDRSYQSYDLPEHGASNPESQTASGQIQQHISLALATLSPQQRAVFVMRHYQHLALKEIGQNLGISEGTVKSLLFRAIRKLQHALSFYRKELGLEEKQ